MNKINCKVRITKPMREWVANAVEKIVEKKKRELSYQRDPKNKELRFTTGLLAECAVLEYLGFPYTKADVAAVDSASTTDLPDLRVVGLADGVKAVGIRKGWALRPMFHKHNNYGQYICLVDEDDYKFVDVIGYLSATDLNDPKNQDDNGIKDALARAKGTKTALSYAAMDYLTDGKVFIK